MILVTDPERVADRIMDILTQLAKTPHFMISPTTLTTLRTDIIKAIELEKQNA